MAYLILLLTMAIEGNKMLIRKLEKNLKNQKKEHRIQNPQKTMLIGVNQCLCNFSVISVLSVAVKIGKIFANFRPKAQVVEN
jgi:hypothetical protein